MNAKRQTEPAVKILVVSFSTSEKTIHSAHTTARDTTERRIPASEGSRPKKYLRSAAEMFTGAHHESVMAGVGQVRRMLGNGTASVIFVSPVYGVIGEHEPIAPYTENFFMKKTGWIRDRARKLDIPARIRAAIQGWPLVIFLLHRQELMAIKPPLEPETGQRLVFLAGEDSRGLLAHSGVTVVSVTPSDSGMYGARGAALKGRLFEFYAAALSDEGHKLWKRTRQDDLPITFMSAARRAMAKQILLKSSISEANRSDAAFSL